MGYLIFLKYIRALASQLFSEDPRLNDVIDEVTLDRKKATDFLKYRTVPLRINLTKTAV